MADITFSVNDPLHIKIDTDNTKYLNSIDKLLAYHYPNYQFLPAFRAGGWDGKKHFLIKGNRTFPFGLFFDVIRYTFDNWSELSLSVDDEVKNLFTNSINIDFNYDLKLTPYFYQDESIQECLKKKNGIIRSATASGKSLIITYVIKLLYNNDLSNKILLIVDSIGALGQFKQDMIDYGMNVDNVGMIGDGIDEIDSDIIISTWQSLKNRMKYLKLFDAVLVDECHGTKSDVLNNIMKHTINANYRFGFTGTLPDEEVDEVNIRSYLGPILKEYSSNFLAEHGYIAKCHIHKFNLNYKDEFKGSYDTIKDDVFTNEWRLNLIREIALQTDDPTLILVGKVKKEGEVLEEYLKDIDKPVVFLSGRDNTKEREKWRQIANSRENIVIIATYGIFQQAINIKPLKYVMLGAPFKSKIRILQSIGRALRKCENKKDGSVIFDLSDNTRYLKKHSDIRTKHYITEGFDIVNYNFSEDDDIKKKYKFFLE